MSKMSRKDGILSFQMFSQDSNITPVKTGSLSDLLAGRDAYPDEEIREK